MHWNFNVLGQLNTKFFAPSNFSIHNSGYSDFISAWKGLTLPVVDKNVVVCEWAITVPASGHKNVVPPLYIYHYKIYLSISPSAITSIFLGFWIWTRFLIGSACDNKAFINPKVVMNPSFDHLSEQINLLSSHPMRFIYIKKNMLCHFDLDQRPDVPIFKQRLSLVLVTPRTF